MSIRIQSAAIRKWLSFGTGIGIEAGSRDLRVVIARVRPGFVRILHAATIERFHERPAAEWGKEYADILKQAGVSHLAATVLLPRADVVVRQVSLAGVPDKDLGSAIDFQIDSLHPYGEGNAAHSWARIGPNGSVLIGITRRELVDEYLTLFAEAGVKVNSFAFSASAMYSAVRLLATPPANGFVWLTDTEDGIEGYGESAAKPVFSAVFNTSMERAAALAAAELRLQPAQSGEGQTEKPHLLPKPISTPKDLDLSRNTLAYAAALAGACPWLALPVNLLPAEKRSTNSRAMFVPTAVLAICLVLIAIGLMSVKPVGDRRYMTALGSEIARLEPQARKAGDLDKAIENIRTRTRLLDDFRRRTKSDLDALQELTKILPENAWLTSVELTRGTMTAGGEAEQAAAALKLIDGSPMFEKSEFTMPIGRAGSNEVFGIRAQREGSAK